MVTTPLPQHHRQPGPSIPAIALAALGLFAALAGYLRWMQAGAFAPAEAGALAGRAPPPPQVVDVHRAVQAMHLVTLTLDTTVVVTARDENVWRGDIDATLRVPVRQYYGADFSRARVDSVRMGPLLTSYLVILPPPRRIATETFPEREVSDVSTGWLRFRSIGGEHALGMARRSSGEEARRMVLNPADEQMLLEETRGRVAQLVRAIVGDNASVTVIFDESLAAAPAEAAEPPR